MGGGSQPSVAPAAGYSRGHSSPPRTDAKTTSQRSHGHGLLPRHAGESCPG
jgi:hypothetical protein